MDWIESIRRTVDFIENNLFEKTNIENTAKNVCISPYYLQKGFKIMTGYTVSEYARNRKLYLAALDLLSKREKVIDIAYKYGYDTPESFAKAFMRFHGVSPSQLKENPTAVKVFLPLKIKVSIQGGYAMDYVVEKMNRFSVIGFEKEVSFENSYAEIPKLWNEFREKYFNQLSADNKPKNDIEEAICNYHISEFGICIDDIGNGRFRYLIAGAYTGGKVPQGLTTYEFKDIEWAKFSCKGPMPGALQSVNTKIFKEWLPGNPDYEIAMGANIEWYSKGDIKSNDYESGIWIPVKKK